MPQETTVLIIDAHHFQASLEEQLGSRQVYVEHATASDAVQVASVLVPDLVVVSGKSGADVLVQELGTVRPLVPTIVVADRAQVKKLREQDLALAALVPHDLPTAAISHRIATMARKSASGELVIKPPKSASPDSQASSTKGAKSASSQSTMPKPGGATKSAFGANAGKLGTKKVPTRSSGLADRLSQKAGLSSTKSSERKTAGASKSLGSKGAPSKTTPGSTSAVRSTEQKSSIKPPGATKKIGGALTQKTTTPLHKASAPKTTSAVSEVKNAAPSPARAGAQGSASLKATLIGVAAPALGTEVPPKSPANPFAKNNLAETDLSTKSTAPAQFVPLPLDDLDPDSITLSDAGNDEEEETVRLTGNKLISSPPLPKETIKEPSPVQVQASVSKSSAPSPFFPRTETGGLSSSRGEELSMVAQLPVDLKQPLSGAKRPSTALRLAYLDTDLTRADLLTGALRRKGLEVFPVTPDIEQTRWPLLRRFAPQALVVDEKGLARRSADWVETFRGDPFLGHVPLIVLRFSRLYQEDNEVVDLDPLLTLVEHLGQDEVALLEKLAPAREVDLKMSQLGPVRLLQLLTEQDRNTRIDCRSENEEIAWPLGPGYAGNAKLRKTNSEKVLAKLSPKEAMAWLLRHEDLDVAVHEHTEPLAHPSESIDSVELLREVTDALGIPEKHQSVRPGVRSGGPTSSQSAATPTEPNTANLVESIGPRSAGRGHDDSPLPVEIPAAPRAPAARLTDPSPQMAGLSAGPRLWGQVQKGTLDAYASYQARIAPLAAKLPPQARALLAPGLLLFTGLLVLLLVFGLNSEQSNTSGKAAATVEAGEAKEAQEPTADQAPAKPTQKTAAQGQNDSNEKDLEVTDEPDAPIEGDLWKIAADTRKDGCEIIAGGKKPGVESPAKAQNYLRQARKMLMIGNTEDALELMCLSGLSDSKGPAAEALAEYYLSHRSLGQAEHWVKISLQADSERRKSQELLADIENQKGNHEKSRDLLLKTMKLTGRETSTLAAIGRKLIADAHQATKGGDLPRAERALRRAAVLVPESSGVALELAQVLAERKMADAALLWAERAYSLDPTSAHALFYAGNLAAKTGRKKAAKKYFQRIPPGDPLYQKATARISKL